MQNHLTCTQQKAICSEVIKQYEQLKNNRYNIFVITFYYLPYFSIFGKIGVEIEYTGMESKIFF